MVKKVIFVVIGFLLGMSLGFYFEAFFRGIIQDVFKFSTSNKVQFNGKNIFIFSSRIFEYILGFTLALFLLSNLNLKFEKVFKNVMLCLLIFGISVFVVSAINANLKVIECTMCDDGILYLHWNNINFGFTIGLSAICSIIPSVIRLIKKSK